jgi:hypothetical protein
MVLLRRRLALSRRAPGDAYDLILFDCPPAIGYQSMNAVFAADVLYIPSGPGYWEYDSTTSFIGQLAEALEDLSRFGRIVPAGKMNAAQGVPRRALPAHPLRAGQRPAPRDAAGLHQGVRGQDDRAPDRDDARRRTVGALPVLDLRDRLPGHDARDMAPRARLLRPRLRRVQGPSHRPGNRMEAEHDASGASSISIFPTTAPAEAPAPSSRARRGPMAAAIVENADALRRTVGCRGRDPGRERSRWRTNTCGSRSSA